MLREKVSKSAEELKLIKINKENELKLIKINKENISIRNNLTNFNNNDMKNSNLIQKTTYKELSQKSFQYQMDKYDQHFYDLMNQKNSQKKMIIEPNFQPKNVDFSNEMLIFQDQENLLNNI